jgi:hypothetical protein
MCPKGDDPLTMNQNYRKIRLTVYTSDPSGSLGIEFLGTTTYMSLSTITSKACETALESSDKIGDVACTYTEVSSAVHQFDITFYSWPTFVKENNLHSNDGNPAISEFYCDVSQVGSSTYCEFTDVQNSEIRGTCVASSFVVGMGWNGMEWDGMEWNGVPGKGFVGFQLLLFRCIVVLCRCVEFNLQCLSLCRCN